MFLIELYIVTRKLQISFAEAFKNVSNQFYFKEYIVIQVMGCSPGELSEELCSFSNLSVTSPTSQLILQPFRCFTYVTAHSPTLPLLHLHHSSFSNPSFASPMSQALRLIHLASRPCCLPWQTFTTNYWSIPFLAMQRRQWAKWNLPRN